MAIFKGRFRTESRGRYHADDQAALIDIEPMANVREIREKVLSENGLTADKITRMFAEQATLDGSPRSLNFASGGGLVDIEGKPLALQIIRRIELWNDSPTGKIEVSGNLGLNWMPSQPSWIEYAFPKSPWEKNHWHAATPILVHGGQSVLTLNPVAGAIPYRIGVYGVTGSLTQFTTSFGVLADTRIHSDEQNSNFGFASNCTFGRLSGRISRSLLYFNMSSIPSWAIVLAASLILPGAADSLDTPGILCKAQRIIQPGWIELEATWLDWATGQGWATAGGDLTTTDEVSFDMIVVAGFGTHTITGMAPLAQDAVTNRGGQLHICLKKDVESSDGREFFNSREAFGTDPQFSVTYLA